MCIVDKFGIFLRHQIEPSVRMWYHIYEQYASRVFRTSLGPYLSKLHKLGPFFKNVKKWKIKGKKSATTAISLWNLFVPSSAHILCWSAHFYRQNSTSGVDFSLFIKVHFSTENSSFFTRTPQQTLFAWCMRMCPSKDTCPTCLKQEF